MTWVQSSCPYSNSVFASISVSFEIRLFHLPFNIFSLGSIIMPWLRLYVGTNAYGNSFPQLTLRFGPQKNPNCIINKHILKTSCNHSQAHMDNTLEIFVCFFFKFCKGAFTTQTGFVTLNVKMTFRGEGP